MRTGTARRPLRSRCRRRARRILACADIEEAIVLRKAGVTAEILIFGALGVSDVDGVFEHNLTPTISTPGAGRSLQAAAAKHGARLRCHLKIDTGMNRLGLRHDNLEFTLPELIASRNLEIVAVYTHFATADDPDSPLFQTQRERFEQVLCATAAAWRDAATAPRGEQRGDAPRFARVVRPRSSRADDVRRHSSAAGVDDSAQAGHVASQPRGRGQGRARRRNRRLRRALDGAKARAASPSCPPGTPTASIAAWPAAARCSFAATRAPIVGAVNMDMITVDVSDVKVETGDEVVIIGAQGDDRIEVREIAAAIGTNPYEVLCRVGTRIERIY